MSVSILAGHFSAAYPYFRAPAFHGCVNSLTTVFQLYRQARELL